jgi:iron complex outermembrane receptor protein
MNLKHLTLALLASTAVPASAVAQEAAPATPAGAPAAPAGAPAHQGDSRAMNTLTAAPTDFGTVQWGNGNGEGDGAPNAYGVTRNDIGGGYMIEEDATKTRSTVTRDAVDKQAPSANPYQLIEMLPGVTQFSYDNYGMNGGNIHIRGFNSDHLGLTIEGVPINDSGNYALYPQEYIDADNIGSISIAQGSPDLDSPHIGAIGGVINMYMIDPPKTMGGVISNSFGTDNANREFIRLNTGDLGNGFRAFISYSHFGDNHWNQIGEDERHNVEFKGVWDISAGNTARLSILYNNSDSAFYPDFSKSQLASNTAYYQNFLPSSFFSTSTAAGGINQSANNAANYIAFHKNPFQNLIVSAPSNFTFTPDLTYDVIPYLWYGYGNGGGTTTLTDGSAFYQGNLKITGMNWGSTINATGDKFLIYSPSNTETERPGIINKLNYTLGDHKFVLGYWLEDALQIQTGPLSRVNSDGTISNDYGDTNNLTLPSTAVCTLNHAANGMAAGTVVACPTGDLQKRDAYTHTITNEIFGGDVWTLNNQWTLEYGAKQVFVTRLVTNDMPYDPSPRLWLHDDAFLPQAGLRWRPDDKNQFFASVNTTFHSVPNYNLWNAYSLTTGVRTPTNIIAPERGISFEIGHRYQGELFATSVSGFLARVNNYQISTNAPDPAGSNSFVSVTIDAGDVLVYGVDWEVGTRRWNDFRPYVAGEFLHTEQLDNLQTTNTANGVAYLATKGKELPIAPNYQFAFGVDYDNGHLIGNLQYKLYGPQYSTLLNDEGIPAFGRLNGMIGYRFPDYWWAKAPTIQLNLANLLNQRQLVGVYAVTNNANAATAIGGGAIAGNAPYYYPGQGFSLLATLKTAF